MPCSPCPAKVTDGPCLWWWGNGGILLKAWLSGARPLLDPSILPFQSPPDLVVEAFQALQPLLEEVQGRAFSTSGR